MTAECGKSAEAVIAAAFGRGEPVFLVFIGGKDPLVLSGGSPLAEQTSDPIREGHRNVLLDQWKNEPDKQEHAKREGGDAEQSESQPLKGREMRWRPEVVGHLHGAKIGENR